jgi:hypothetical protein
VFFHVQFHGIAEPVLLNEGGFGMRIPRELPMRTSSILISRVQATICRSAASEGRAAYPALQCRAVTSDNFIVHSNADSRVRTAAPKPGILRIPVAVLDHLPDLHGAEFKVLLVLCRHQAQGGGRDQKTFSYSIPQIMEDTGLCPRAISKAISRLAKHRLILRVKKHGALPNRYRVLLEPAAPQKIPKARKPALRRREPARAVKAKGAPVAVPQKRTGGRRRKDSSPLLQVEIPNLFEGFE